MCACDAALGECKCVSVLAALRDASRVSGDFFMRFDDSPKAQCRVDVVKWLSNQRAALGLLSLFGFVGRLGSCPLAANPVDSEVVIRPASSSVAGDQCIARTRQPGLPRKRRARTAIGRGSRSGRYPRGLAAIQASALMRLRRRVTAGRAASAAKSSVSGRAAPISADRQ